MDWSIGTFASMNDTRLQLVREFQMHGGNVTRLAPGAHSLSKRRTKNIGKV